MGDLKDFSSRVPELLDLHYDDSLLSARIRRLIKPKFFREWTGRSWELDLMGLSSLSEAIQTDNCVCFEGPLGMHIRVGLKSFDLSTPFRWWVFLEDEALQQQLFNLIRRVTTALGGSTILIVPDNATVTSGFQNLVMKPASIDEIQDKMLVEIGAPCPNAKELHLRKEADIDYDGYLMVNFDGSIQS